MASQWATAGASVIRLLSSQNSFACFRCIFLPLAPLFEQAAPLSVAPLVPFLEVPDRLTDVRRRETLGREVEPRLELLPRLPLALGEFSFLLTHELLALVMDRVVADMEIRRPLGNLEDLDASGLFRRDALA